MEIYISTTGTPEEIVDFVCRAKDALLAPATITIEGDSAPEPEETTYYSGIRCDTSYPAEEGES